MAASKNLIRNWPAQTRVTVASHALITLVIAVGVVVLTEAILVKPYRIPTGSMIPTLQVGQRILVDRLNTKPGLGDIVVFHPPEGALRGRYGICGSDGQGYGQKRACDRSAGPESSATFVKRVVGLPGDHLTIVAGTVVRNGTPERGAYVQPCYLGPRVCDFPTAITVPRGEYFVMGDNRGASDDSRYWGPIPQQWIIGVAVATYWPVDRIGLF